MLLKEPIATLICLGGLLFAQTPKQYAEQSFEKNRVVSGKNNFSSPMTSTGSIVNTGKDALSQITSDIVVDGVTYTLTAAGIQAALDQAKRDGGGRVILPPTPKSS